MKAVKKIDKVYTVSNYSMQILMNRSLKEISWFTQRNSFSKSSNAKAEEADYILIVSGGRPEKNLIRTLEAFQKFKKNVQTKTTMVVTGVNDEFVEILKKDKKIDINIMEKAVVFKSYVSHDELNSLYSNCKYVAFISKGEGYGLPVREALNYGKPVLASRVTSIPEIAGAAVHYVDPFEVDSIYRGFLYYNDPENLKVHAEYASERRKIIKQLTLLDKKIFLNDLFYEG